MKLLPIKLILLLAILATSFSVAAQSVQRDSLVVLIAKAGRAYQKLDTKKSLQYAQTALNQAYELNDHLLLARTYNIIGLNYNEYGEYKKAEEAYLNGLKALDKTNDILIKSWLEANIANLYQVSFKDYDRAITYHLRSLEHSKKLNSEYDVLLSILNLAILYFDKNEFDKGYPYLQESEKYLFKINEPEIFITYNSLLGLYAQHKKEYKAAENYYLEALKYCSLEADINLKSSHEMELYDDIAHFYAKVGDKDKGYDFLLKHLTLKDSLYSKEKTEAIASYANQIDLDLYKREINKIEKLNEEQKKKILFSKIVAGLLIFIVLNLLFSVFLLKRNQKQKNKLIAQIESKNRQLEIARAKAEELSALKSQFISNVSHELRTPLYGVIGLANILEQDFPGLTNNKILQSLNFSADYLMNLINDLLELQKIEANVVKLEFKPYSIQHEIHNIVESLNVIAQKNNNEVVIKNKKFDVETVETDKLKLNQILYNLLSNALKFTTDGQITISVDQRIISNQKIELIYKISDTGNGISEKNLEVIFDKFSQFHTKGSDYQGTGLGLSIVKQLIQVFGGTINIESQLNKGTTFTFTIPCKPYNLNEQIEDQKLYADLSNLNLNVLLVENNEINRIVSQHSFKNKNIACTIVASAKEALQVIEEQEFSVILTDINMPEMDGFELAKQLRAKNVQAPIIALTAYSKQDIIHELDQTDIQEVVTKPYDFEYLLQVIYKYVSVHSMPANR